MATHLDRLCRSIIEDDFGEFVAIRAFAKLSLKQTREALFVLCQQHIVTWAETVERSGKAVVYYSADKRECLRRLLNSKVISRTEEWFGAESRGIEPGSANVFDSGRPNFAEQASAVIRVVMRCGRIQLPVVIKELESDYEKGFLSSQIAPGKIIELFHKLVKERYLTCDVPGNAVTRDDKDMAADSKEIAKLSVAPTAKAIQEVKDNRMRLAAAEEASMEIAGMKRKLFDADGTGNKSKKRRTVEEYVDDVDEEAYWRLNYDRYLVRLRNLEIVEMFSNRMNEGCAAIVHRVLELGEDRMKSCRIAEGGKSPPIASHQLVHTKVEGLDLSGAVYVDREDEGRPRSSTGNAHYIKQITDVLCLDETGVFLKADEKGGGTFQVHLKRAAAHLRQRAFEDTVQEAFGHLHCRLVRILQEQGRLEDRQLARLSKLPLKDAREKLMQLASKGVVELQEVPKSADRTPSRSYYLWFFDAGTFARRAKLDMYRTLANLRARRRAERKSRARLLEKLERSDVKANPEFLTDADREQVTEMDTVLSQLEIQEARIEEFLRIFEEY